MKGNEFRSLASVEVVSPPVRRFIAALVAAEPPSFTFPEIEDIQGGNELPHSKTSLAIL
jgi:hypothetical protein